MGLSMPARLKQLTEQFCHCDSAAVIQGTDLQTFKASVSVDVVKKGSNALEARHSSIKPTACFIKLRSRLGQIKNEDNVEGL